MKEKLKEIKYKNFEYDILKVLKDETSIAYNKNLSKLFSGVSGRRCKILSYVFTVC